MVLKRVLVSLIVIFTVTAAPPASKVYERTCSAASDFKPLTLLTDIKNELKLAHFKNRLLDVSKVGYDAAHVYPQGKIAENVNSYLKKNEVNNLRNLIDMLFEPDTDAYVFDLDQTESGVTNSDHFVGPIKYTDYMSRNGANVVTMNNNLKVEVKNLVNKYVHNGSLDSTDYQNLLIRMCWAPANLRYGRKRSNGSIVGKSLDPMGDVHGKITTQEKWFRDAFK